MMTHKRWQWVIGGVILLVLLAANVKATHDVLTEPHPGHNDFLTVWEAGRSFWRDGLDPYSDAATINIQTRIYGRPAEGDEFPNYYAYPLYTLWLILPLDFTGFAWASAIYMVVSEGCFIVALLLLIDLFHWRPPPWLLAVFLLWALLQYFAARGLILGQISNVIYLVQVLVLWALARDRDRLAGAMLALSTMKPQMGFLLVPFLLLWGVQTRRMAFVVTFAGVWAALMLSSFVLQPDWMQGWIDQLREYPSYTEIGAPTNIVMQDYLGFGPVGEWLVNMALWGVMLWAWHGVLLRGQAERFDWTIMLTLTVTHLSALRTATPHFVIFTIPLVFYFQQIGRRRKNNKWIALFLLVTMIVFWVQFVITVDDSFEHTSMYVVVPISTLIVLWMTRRQWWNAPNVINEEAVA